MKKVLTGSSLKIFAVVSMLIDHLGAIVLKNGFVLNAPYSMFSDTQFAVLLTITDICHILGRVAFPIFCFLLVEGFLHTHDLKKYMFQMTLFAMISEPIYDLALTGKLLSIEEQNVLFTLLLGLGVLTVIKMSKNNILIIAIATLSGALLSYKCRLDGWYYGILLVVIFYLFHDKPVVKYLSAILLMYICGLDFTIGGVLDPYFLTAVFSLVLISLYNGKRGMKLKYFFYSFYPAHLLLLWLASSYIICF